MKRKPFEVPSLRKRMRGKALPKVNAKRKAKRVAEERVYGPYHKWIAKLPCILAGLEGHRCFGAVAGHHLHSVGAGGEDEGNEVPLCRRGHAQLHTLGPASFCGRWKISLTAIAATLANRWQSEGTW